MLIDTHAHIYDQGFLDDFDRVIERAKSGDVQQILLPNIDEDSIPKVKALHQKDPNYFIPMMGIHPCYVKQNWEEQITLVRKELTNNDFYCAVGEIGIDLYWDKSLKEEQAKAFRAQIQLAREFSLPIVIHARESFDEIFEILDEENDAQLKGVFHCFTGNLEQAQKVIAYGGFLMGLGGVLTFKNSGLDKVIEQVDMQHLILETDCPYLTPAPHRGKRNESAYLPLVAQKLAELKNLTLEEVAAQTSGQAKALFSL